MFHFNYFLRDSHNVVPSFFVGIVFITCVAI